MVALGVPDFCRLILALGDQMGVDAEDDGDVGETDRQRPGGVEGEAAIRQRADDRADAEGKLARQALVLVLWRTVIPVELLLHRIGVVQSIQIACSVGDETAHETEYAEPGVSERNADRQLHADLDRDEVLIDRYRAIGAEFGRDHRQRQQRANTAAVSDGH